MTVTCNNLVPVFTELCTFEANASCASLPECELGRPSTDLGHPLCFVLSCGTDLCFTLAAQLLLAEEEIGPRASFCFLSFWPSVCRQPGAQSTILSSTALKRVAASPEFLIWPGTHWGRTAFPKLCSTEDQLTRCPPVVWAFSPLASSLKSA